MQRILQWSILLLFIYLTSSQAIKPRGMVLEVEWGNWVQQPGTSSQYNYYKDVIYPAIVNYVKSTFIVTKPLYSGFTSTATSCNGADINPRIQNKVYYADFVIIPHAYLSSKYVANSNYCQQDPTTNRPIVGLTKIGTDYYKVAPDDPGRHEQVILSILHELFHILGIASNNFKNFPNNGKNWKGTIREDNGGRSQVYDYLTFPTANTFARQWFNCPTLAGVFIENDGGAGNELGHLEKRFFPLEFISQNTVRAMQISPITLSVLNASTWYNINMTNADPYTFGKNAGCDFFDNTVSEDNANFDNFWCNDEGSPGVVYNGRGHGTCVNRTSLYEFNTKYVKIASDQTDCFSYSYRPVYAPDLQSYGTEKLNGAFLGSLRSTRDRAPKTDVGYCFEYSCKLSASNTYALSIILGGQSYPCNQKTQKVSVPGYAGSVTCPDPQVYCTQTGFDKCHRGCWGQGYCDTSSGRAVCKCYQGYAGWDCSLTKDTSAFKTICGDNSEFCYTATFNGTIPQSNPSNNSNTNTNNPPSMANYTLCSAAHMYERNGSCYCSEGYYVSVDKYSCVQGCPKYSSVTPGTNKCDCDDTAIQFNNSCVCRKSVDKSLCVRSCPSNASLVNDTCTCNQGFSASGSRACSCSLLGVDNSTCMVNGICPSNSQASNGSCVCRSGFNANSDNTCTTTSMDGKSPIASCPANSTYDNSNNKCVCNTNFYSDLDNATCITSCNYPNGRVISDGRGHCICNQPYYLIFNSNCVCRKTLDNSTCVSNCPPNSVVIGSQCTCVSPYVANATSKTCNCNLFGVDNTTCVSTCPDNSTNISGICRCNNGFKTVNNTCMVSQMSSGAMSTSCPSNASPVNGSCQCNPGYIVGLDNSSCLSSCPRDSVNISGACTCNDLLSIDNQTCTSLCPRGSSLKQSKVCTCDDNFYFSQDSKSCTCQGYIGVDNNTCLTGDCPSNSVAVNNSCSCLPGYTPSAFSNTCYKTIVTSYNATVKVYYDPEAEVPNDGTDDADIRVEQYTGSSEMADINPYSIMIVIIMIITAFYLKRSNKGTELSIKIQRIKSSESPEMCEMSETSPIKVSQ